MNNTLYPRPLTLALLAVVGCAHAVPTVLAESSSSAAQAPLARTASATLVPLGKHAVSGSLLLTELAAGGVQIVGSVHGLGQGGLHGFHVHEKGDCSAADGISAGGHFNPTQAVHGDPAAPGSHLGDLGNLQPDHAGNAAVSIVRLGVDLTDGPRSLVGRAFIVHQGVDDLHGQPAGNSGERIACGLIRLTQQAAAGGRRLP